MSAISSTDPDIWEFINCCKCHLLFSPDGHAPPPIPFWVTECGHVICNNHIQPDRSCAHCKAQNVEFIPLQREMEPPFSDWFRAVPYSLDMMANAAKFQMETLAVLVRYYKTKYIGARDVINRVREERREFQTLKKTLNNLQAAHEQLKAENEQLRRSIEYGASNSAASVNSNGKRRMTEAYRAAGQSELGMFSSPRSLTTPLGGRRLTLPPDQQQPAFSNRAAPQAVQAQTHDRPGTNMFRQQYSYNGEQPSRSVAPTPQPRHASTFGAMAPPPQQQQQQRPRQQANTFRTMPPPADPPEPRQNPNRFLQQRHQSEAVPQAQAQAQPGPSRASRFRPAATPRMAPAQVASTSYGYAHPPAQRQPERSFSEMATTPRHAAMPQTPRGTAMQQQQQQQQQAFQQGRPSRFEQGGSAALKARAGSMRVAGQPQRAPFVPGAQFG